MKAKDSKKEILSTLTCDRSLDRPCYCCVYIDDQECWEVRSTPIQQGVLLGDALRYCRPLCHEESNDGMELVANIPQKLNRETSFSSSTNVSKFKDLGFLHKNRNRNSNLFKSLDHAHKLQLKTIS